MIALSLFCMFAGITAIAFTSGTDFSFLGNFLRIGGFIAFGLIVCSILFGFTLGLIFSVVMVMFASVAILYTTSNIINHYAPHQYVAACGSFPGAICFGGFIVLLHSDDSLENVFS